MKHFLHVGHFVRTEALDGVISVEKPLDPVVVENLLLQLADRDTDGSWSFSGDKVKIKNGYLICPFLSAGVNHRSFEFVSRLYDATGCLIVWLEQGAIHSPESLRGEVPGWD